MKRRNKTSKRAYFFNAFLPFLFVFMVISTFTTLAHSAEVTLTWNSVATADGYKVYYGTASGTYQSPTDVGNQTSHTFTLSPGDYYFAVTAYNNYGESGYSPEIGPTTIAASNPPTSVSLVSDLPSPQPEGTNVTFTAQANGGSGSYEYQFWSRSIDGKWSINQDYSSSNTYQWGTTINSDMIGVLTRNIGSNADYQVSRCITFSTDMNPPTSVYLVSDLSSPQPEGTNVTFTAQANGGSGSYEYQFWSRNTDGNWSIEQDYSSSNTYLWGATASTDMIGVLSRNIGANADYQVSRCIIFSTDMNPPTSVSLSSDLPSPQPEGTSVTFTAQANGGSGNYEFKFWLRDPNGIWTMVQDYSSSSNYIWNNNGFTGLSYIQIWARNAGSNDYYQVYNSIPFRTN